MEQIDNLLCEVHTLAVGEKVDPAHVTIHNAFSYAPAVGGLWSLTTAPWSLYCEIVIGSPANEC